ncbi:hypothetical protein AMECASPLE_021169 [Ameca splendens]|uniref:Uncharacterized protein n=1 Tax=Ameca splendens TaxID=208324 RepID=A0ABV0YRQ5_9TELE
MTEEGKFREKASILHKIAKKKCQVEDSEKANGVASRADRLNRSTRQGLCWELSGTQFASVDLRKKSQATLVP